MAVEEKTASKQIEDFQARLEIARYHRRARQFSEATADYAGILKEKAPEPLQRTAMIELAETAEDQNDLARAQQIYAQWLTRWSQDVGVPEIYLRQGLVYRRMGLNNLAVSKFYAVMTSALVLKPDRIDYYQKLVLRAQNEIAETQFQRQDWKNAAESFGRLLKLESPPVNRSTLQYKFIRCLTALGKYGK